MTTIIERLEKIEVAQAEIDIHLTSILVELQAAAAWPIAPAAPPAQVGGAAA